MAWCKAITDCLWADPLKDEILEEYLHQVAEKGRQQTHDDFIYQGYHFCIESVAVFLPKNMARVEYKVAGPFNTKVNLAGRPLLQERMSTAPFLYVRHGEVVEIKEYTTKINDENKPFYLFSLELPTRISLFHHQDGESHATLKSRFLLEQLNDPVHCLYREKLTQIVNNANYPNIDKVYQKL
ncbi:hypothetical protein [Parashewanella tropica]|uniref:hypothetical protein n=1 Tax=Parashewanella tropica TaxID=2547970 RepID=UPI0010593923|nr:hypothetical protein [Parashewanella tropica]